MLLPEDRRKRRRIWITGLSALLAVAGACVWSAADRIPREIAARATAALRIAAIAPHVTVAAEGRTLVLSGELSDPYTHARALAVAGSIRGVRAVVDRIALAQAASTLRAEPIRSGTPEPPTASLPPGPPAKPSPAEPPAPADSTAALPPAPTSGGQEDSAAAGQTGGRSPGGPETSPPVRVAESPAAAVPAPAESTAAAETARPPAAPVLDFPVLLFAFDRARPTPQSERRLQEAITLLKQHPGLRVELAGHTDSSGARSYNRRLSERRAAAIADRMIAAGIDASRLQTRGYGEGQPRAENRSRAGRALNRRVEIIAIP